MSLTSQNSSEVPPSWSDKMRDATEALRRALHDADATSATAPAAATATASSSATSTAPAAVSAKAPSPTPATARDPAPTPARAPAGVLMVLTFHTPVLSYYQKIFHNERGKPHAILIKKLIASIREHNPKLPIAVVTDDADKLHEATQEMGAEKLHDVSTIQMDFGNMSRSYQEKLFAMKHSPFDRTLLLDTDTICCADLQPAFTVLDTADVGFTRISENVSFPAEAKHYDFADAKVEEGARITSAERFYSAFMTYKKTDKTMEFIDLALNLSLRSGLPDQEALLAAKKQQHGSGADIRLLSQEYLYVIRPTEMPVIVARDVLVVHGINATCAVNDVKGARVLEDGAVLYSIK